MSETPELSTVWPQLVSDLRPNQRAFLQQSAPVALHEHTAIVAVPNDFTRTRVEGRLRVHLEDALSAVFGHQIRLAIVVDQSLDAATPAAPGPDDRFDEEDLGPETLRPVPDGDPGPTPSTTFPERGYPEHNASGDGFGAHGYDVPSDPTSVSPRIDSAAGFGAPSERTAAPSTDGPTGHAAHTPGPATGPAPESTDRQAPATRLNKKYTFDTFVIGASNRFPHAAAVAVSEAPGKSYNPLLVYGDSGLGKTHLLHAIGHYVRSLYSGARVRYVSSEEFTNEFINSLRDNSNVAFQRRYRDIDVLLIDDIQFLEGKEQTQEEFFHTFNALHNANKQIVLTSDRPPKRLEALEDRLRSRFEWGLITDVQAPDLETRIAILRKKAAMDRLTAPPEVLEFIASKIHTNIRELEGALIRVTAFANLNRQAVDLTLAEIVLRDLIPEGGEPEITAASIIAQTAAYFAVNIEDLTGPSRGRHLVLARQIAMYLCRELTSDSLPTIGKHFGNRDHTTVMYADRKIRGLLAERRAVFNQVTELTNRIKMQARGA